MRATLFDFGAGNLHSLAKAIACADIEVRIESDSLRALETDALVLPGVGAFQAAAERIAPARATMRTAIEAGLPCLGICLGMQLLFESSEEGAGAGLGIFAGNVSRLRAHRVPQIGWNAIEDAQDRLFADAGLDIAYFANGYACRPTDDTSVLAWTTHETDRFPSAVRRARVLGIQFHPEKSSGAGLRFLGAALKEITR
jgi:glutamine amidotransferase